MWSVGSPASIWCGAALVTYRGWWTAVGPTCLVGGGALSGSEWMRCIHAYPYRVCMGAFQWPLCPALLSGSRVWWGRWLCGRVDAVCGRSPRLWPGLCKCRCAFPSPAANGCLVLFFVHCRCVVVRFCCFSGMVLAFPSCSVAHDADPLFLAPHSLFGWTLRRS